MQVDIECENGSSVAREEVERKREDSREKTCLAYQQLSSVLTGYLCLAHLLPATQLQIL